MFRDLPYEPEWCYFIPYHPTLLGDNCGNIKAKMEEIINAVYCSLYTKAKQRVTQRTEESQTRIVIVVGVCFSFHLLPPFLLHLEFLNSVTFGFGVIFILES